MNACLICLLALCLTPAIGLAQDIPMPATSRERAGEPSPYPHWFGEWRVSPDLNKAIGFDGVRDEHFTYPTSFQLTFDRKIGENAKRYRDFFKQMGHETTVTGTWATRELLTEDGVPQEFRVTDCVVTTDGKATFLWLVGVPFINIYGGKVSFVEGNDHQHDVMFIDFNTMPKHLSGGVRARETVAYQRAPVIASNDVPSEATHSVD